MSSATSLFSSQPRSASCARTQPSSAPQVVFVCVCALADAACFSTRAVSVHAQGTTTTASIQTWRTARDCGAGSTSWPSAGCFRATPSNSLSRNGRCNTPLTCAPCAHPARTHRAAQAQVRHSTLLVTAGHCMQMDQVWDVTFALAMAVLVPEGRPRSCIFPEVARTKHAGDPSHPALTTSVAAQQHWYDLMALHGKGDPKAAAAMTRETIFAASATGSHALMAALIAKARSPVPTRYFISHLLMPAHHAKSRLPNPTTG